MEIRFLKGDATKPIGDGVKIIAHICNNIGGWGKGFVLAISNRWKAPENEYRLWYKEDKLDSFKLGGIQMVQVSEKVFVCNMVAQKGIKKVNNVNPIRYEAVYQCLDKLVKHAVKLNASVHMPRIGCGLAGGDWAEIENIINNTLLENEIETWVYDYN